MVDVLVFGAHPDDVEFGMGASVIKFVGEGRSVAVCVLTRGECGTFGEPEQREGEARKAAEKAGTGFEVLDFNDCQIFDSIENRLKIAQVIRKFKPKLIFTHYHTNTGNHRDHTAHPDHNATGELVRIAARYARFKNMKGLHGEPWNAKEIVYYMLPKNKEPNCFVDVTGYMDKWEEIVKCHESQLQLADGKVLEKMKGRKQGLGHKLGVDFAEGFLVENVDTFDIEEVLDG